MKKSQPRKQKGFTLIEVMVAMAVLVAGVLSLVSIFTQGLRASYQTQIQYIAQQKAQEAMESIFTARDTRLVTSAQINNVSNGGIFMDNAQPLCATGPDGLFGTADDDCTNNPDGIVVAPGPDKIFGTADDVTINLNPWMTRTILIAPVANTTNLKSITVTVKWTFEGQTSQYVIQSLISNFS
ncbi:MAG TPA: prepilin-type N-terminal cleavage/methylation domain-containing protein [Candidatus Acidoferrum sp.]|nr:prepilin-type N-terminal cleavage/methylation domain-containing protein [Candidatus Acidoferrum sp.]